MKVAGYQVPQSSFLSIDKDLAIIVDKIMGNDILKKLLYYTVEDPLSQPELSEEESWELLGKQIRIVPKLKVDKDVQSYIIVSFDNFLPDVENTKYRHNTISFDIICHIDQWQIKDMQLRPFRIAAELDTIFDKGRFSGIGELEFLGCSQLILSDEFAGLSLIYQSHHWKEDKNLDTPVETINDQLKENFNKIFNSFSDTE